MDRRRTRQGRGAERAGGAAESALTPTRISRLGELATGSHAPWERCFGLIIKGDFGGGDNSMKPHQLLLK